jgi:hypothetical protein
VIVDVGVMRALVPACLQLGIGSIGALASSDDMAIRRARVATAESQ